ncbi:uncharacterized protein LOC119643950 [Glossina fuscipes]|uniref:Uncharacterized protein LOC119643950 n=1 Tax=Glossina fuscipes TaxID=7396 RepID=A0A9C6E0W3_9MUSC|nr:uncharacterized protein LOC119643950 [Glossina fuscipes]
MVYISDVIFSELLKKYPGLWGLEEGYICWKVAGRELADVLTKKTGMVITVEDVRLKLKTIKMSLKRLDKSEGTGYTGMSPYVWYAHKLGLKHAVDRITTQMLNYGEVPVDAVCGEIQSDTDCELKKLPEKRKRKQTGKQTENQIEESPFSVKSPDRYNSSNDCSYNVNRYTDDIYEEEPTTSAEAARKEKNKRLEPVVNPDEGQEIEETDSVMPDIEVLREVVRKLTPHDKIVQLHFDEVYTDQGSIYSRTEDILYGCGYILNQKLTETEEYRTVLVFGVRSILTAFNILLSAHPITRYKGNADLLEENLTIAEEIGLDVKAVVCNRSVQNRKTVTNFTNGKYNRQRADGSMYIVVHMYDYIHILDEFHQEIIQHNRRYDATIVTKVAARNAPIWRHWKKRGASLLVTSPQNLMETVQFFTPAMPAMLKTAIDRKFISGAKEIRTYELLAALTKFNSIFHSGKISSTKWQAQKAVLAEVTKYLQATLEVDLLASETVQTMKRFTELMDGLLEAYPGITIQAYRVSHDPLERFFCKIAPMQGKCTRPTTEIMKLVNRLIKSQIDFWGSGYSTTDDYHLIEKMDYRTAEHQAEDKFLPFGLDGVVFDDILTGEVTEEEEDYIRLLTGYGIAQYIREQVRCQECLEDLTQRKEDVCSQLTGDIVANDPRDDVILAHEYLEPEFPKPKVYAAFCDACDIYKSIMQKHMVEANIGKRVQATIVARLAFFREAGSCTNGRNHRTNLLGFIINLLLIGKNWVQPTVTNVSSF